MFLVGFHWPPRPRYMIYLFHVNDTWLDNCTHYIKLNKNHWRHSSNAQSFKMVWTHERYTVKSWFVQLSYDQILLSYISVPLNQRMWSNPPTECHRKDRHLITLMTALCGIKMVTMRKEFISNSPLIAHLLLLIELHFVNIFHTSLCKVLAHCWCVLLFHLNLLMVHVYAGIWSSHLNNQVACWNIWNIFSKTNKNRSVQLSSRLSEWNTGREKKPSPNRKLGELSSHSSVLMAAKFIDSQWVLQLSPYVFEE